MALYSKQSSELWTSLQSPAEEFFKEIIGSMGLAAYSLPICCEYEDYNNYKHHVGEEDTECLKFNS